ncbi:MAG: diguanylate cyclase domain-containing protein [Christensenellales bacterium]|jgi:diguanylate cyclase (GGDEF)-like protein
MDYFDSREYLYEIPLSLFLVSVKSGRVMFASRQAEKKGIFIGADFFQMLLNKADFFVLIKNADKTGRFASALRIEDTPYNAKLSVSNAVYSGIECLLIAIEALKEARIADEDTFISRICNIYTNEKSKNKTFDFLGITARSTGAFCATLYEKRNQRYVIKGEWRDKRNVCIPILSADTDDHTEQEMDRLKNLKKAADKVYAVYKKKYGTQGLIVYFLDYSADMQTRDNIKKYARLYCLLSPDAPSSNKFAAAREGLNSLGQGFVIWDARTRILLFDNKAYREMFGYKNAQQLTENLGVNLTFKSDKTHVESYVDAKGRHYSVTHKLTRLGGRDIVTTIIFDITRYKQVETQLELMAKTDALTGLLNRRAGVDQLKRIYAENKQKRKTLTVCFADIDGLKDINDTYGHGAGDVMIKSIANVLKKYTDKIGVVCRLGGDEFVLILPGFNKSQAKLLTNQINRDAEKCLVGEAQGISMSFGYKEADYGPEETAQTLISIADCDMYQEKRKKSVK